jgi:hypothetical protein
VEISDPQARKAAALAEERRRLEGVRAEREQLRRDSVWQGFRVSPDQVPELRAVVEAAVGESQGSGGRAARGLKELLEDRSCPGAPRLLLELLQDLPPDSAAGYLVRLHEAGVDGLGDAARYAAVLTTAEPISAQTLQDLPGTPFEAGLWRDAQLVLRGQHPSSWGSFVAGAPLSLVDDLLDREGPTAPVRGEDGADRTPYLLARSRPAELDDAQVGELGWEEELWRRRLLADPSHPVPEGVPESVDVLAGVAEGVPVALEAVVDQLSGEPRQLVRQVLDHPADPARWPSELVGETALWSVLDRFCEVSAGQGWPEKEKPPFAVWRELRAAQRELMRVRPRALELLEQPQRSSTRWVREEAVSMAVYLDLRFSEPGETKALSRALERLEGLGSSHPTVVQNILWLRGNLDKDRNSRGPLFNPYLELGVSHGAPPEQWKAAWRELRRELKGRTVELSDVNRAHDMLRDTDASTGGERGRLYVLPVYGDRLSPSPRVPALFVSRARPMRRRTGPPSSEESEQLRQEALKSVLRYALTERTR